MFTIFEFLLETELLNLATPSPDAPSILKFLLISQFQLLDVGSPSQIFREAIKITV